MPRRPAFACKAPAFVVWSFTFAEVDRCSLGQIFEDLSISPSSSLRLLPVRVNTRIEKPGRHVGWLTLVLVNLEAVKG